MRFCYISSSLRAKHESLMYHEIGMFNRSVVNGNSKVWHSQVLLKSALLKYKKAR